MFNKKLIFTLIIFLMAISSVCASDFNSTGDSYNNSGSNIEAVLENASELSLTSSEGEILDDTGSEALNAGQTVYFDASAKSDGTGTKSSPYKYLYDNRITSGMTAYFANGIYSYSGSGKISSTTTFIGQSRENTIIKSIASYYFDLTVSSNSKLILNDLTFDYGHIINNGDLNADNVVFKNSVCDYSPEYSTFSDFSCGGVIFSDAPTEYEVCNINLNNCYFDANHARHGGVIAANYTNIIITNCVFSDSSANRSGGAIYSLNSDLTISKSSFSKSNARYGGAIYSENGELTITDSNFTTSRAYGFGGAIACQLTVLEIENTNFLNYNSLTDSGGAIYGERTEFTISKSSFTNGRADFGGAICSLGGYISVSNTNFQNNTANYGGSIFNMYNSMYIYHSNFKSSSAVYGNAICSYLADMVDLYNNVFINSNGLYIFARYNTLISNNENTGLTNIEVFNTTLFDIGSNVIAPVINYSPQSQSTIPASYDSRDYGYVTPVKNQMYGGNCWAFASIATLEICLKKATGIEFDFSEENIKNLMARYSLVGTDRYPNDGGVDSIAFGYFTDWLGPIYDSADVYDDYSALSSIYSPILHVQNVYFLPVRKDSSDNNAIKRAIMDYGAVAASTAWDTGYHAITLVGWNDKFNGNDYFGNYAKGAWIVKNSWGFDTEDDGYVYMSYERPFRADDEEFHYIYTYIFNDTESYVRNYQYDLGGFNFFDSSSSSDVKYKNIFFAQENEILSAFSTIFKEPTSYEVTVYKGNALVLTQRGYSPAGYYTIPFKTKTLLSKGDEFTICIKNLNSGIKYIPMSTASIFNLGTFEDGISYIDLGSGWCNLYNYHDSPKVACIKAFTTPLALNEVKLNSDKFTSINVNEKITVNFNLDNAQINRGFVTVNIDDKTYYTPVINGKASFKVSFNTIGTHTLKAQYKNNLYSSNQVSFTFNVIDSSGIIVISASDLIKYYGSSDMFSIRITNNGKTVSGAVVKYTIGTTTKTVTTGSDGFAYADIDLAPGSYDVTSEYGGKSLSSKITVKSTISVSDLTYDYGSSYLKATFLNTAGNALSNTQVKFKIGNTEYLATTNSNGVASTSVKLNVGTYTVYAINPQNTETKSFKLTVKKASSVISITSAKSGDKVTLTATLTPSASTGNVIFTVGGNQVNFTSLISNGKATLTLTLNDGTYHAYVSYAGDSNVYSSKSSTISFTVAAHDFVISAPDFTKYYSSAKKMSIRLTDNGEPVAGAAVKCLFEDKTYTFTTDSEGFSDFIIDLNPGTYTLTFQYAGKSVTSKITVKSTISVSDLTYDYGSSYLKATFLNTAGIALSNAKVSFKIGNSLYSATTNSNGVASLRVNLNPGTYNVNAVNPSSNETKSFKLTVEQVIRIFVNDFVKVYGDSKKLIITVKDGKGKPVANQLVKIDVSIEFGSFYKSYSIKTNSKGQVIISFNPMPNDYEADIYSGGDYGFIWITVNKATPKFVALNKVFKRTVKTKVYNVALKSNTNKPMKNVRLVLKVGGKNYVAKTNARGIATFKITKLVKKGTFVASISYAGNSYYNKVIKKVRLYVR